MPKTYKYRWRENGQHKQRTFDSRAGRDSFIARLRSEEPCSSQSFREFALETWLTSHAMLEQSETRWRQNRRDLELHIFPAFGAVPLRDLTTEHLLDLRRRLCTENAGRYRRQLKPKSVNHVLTLSKQIIKVAVERKAIPTNPFAAVKLLPVPEQPFDYWTPEERDRFLRFSKVLDPEFSRLVLVACHTGLRKGELWALQRRQIDFSNRQLIVSATYDHKLRTRLDRTKDGTWGAVAMNDLVVEALKDQTLRSPTSQVFPDLLMADACHKLKRLCLETGTRPIRFHDLRHTFASCLVMAGVPLYSVQRLLRHKTVAMTQRYAHLAPDHLADAVQALCAHLPKMVRVGVREPAQDPVDNSLSTGN